MEKYKLIIFFLLIIMTVSLTSLSIWNDQAGDIYNKKINYNIGDSIEIIVDEKSDVEYKSTVKSYKTSKLSFEGGELTGVFTFVPQGSAEENKNSTEKDQLKIETAMQAIVTGIQGNFLTIQGRKTISMNNKSNQLVLTGQVSLKDINNNKIFSHQIVNSTISITTLLDNQRNVVNARDLVSEVTNPNATTDIITETKLSDAKKEELLLQYFNKILNVIF